MTDIKLTIKGVEIKGVKPIEYKCKEEHGVLLSAEDFDLMTNYIIKQDQLLKKYVQHVRRCEGIDFLDRLNAGGSDVEFTQEEVIYLKTLHTPFY